MTEQELVEKMARAMWEDYMIDPQHNGAKMPTWGMLLAGTDRPIEFPEFVNMHRQAMSQARAALSVIREAEFTVVPSDIRRAFYYPIEMPVTADGHGPATVGVDAVKITYEVWDCLLNSHGSHDNLPDAINQAIALNSRAMIAASPIGEK